MIRDGEIVKRLNLLRSAAGFVLREKGDRGEADVLNPASVPDGDGVYWVSGVTTLKSGPELPSVFRVDTDAGGELLSVYWFVDGCWYDHDEADACAALGLERTEVSPFDWAYSVPMTRDVFHD